MFFPRATHQRKKDGPWELDVGTWGIYSLSYQNNSVSLTGFESSTEMTVIGNIITQEKCSFGKLCYRVLSLSSKAMGSLTWKKKSTQTENSLKLSLTYHAKWQWWSCFASLLSLKTWLMFDLHGLCPPGSLPVSALEQVSQKLESFLVIPQLWPLCYLNPDSASTLFEDCCNYRP